MKTFYKAIYNRFASTSTGGYPAIYNKVGGRFFLAKAPQDTKFPYILYSLISQVHDWQFQSDFEKMRLQFTLYSSSELINQASTMCELLTALYDDSILNTSGYKAYHTIRRSISPEVEFLLDTPDAKTVWQKTIEYDVLLEKI